MAQVERRRSEVGSLTELTSELRKETAELRAQQRSAGSEATREPGDDTVQQLKKVRSYYNFTVIAFLVHLIVFLTHLVELYFSNCMFDTSFPPVASGFRILPTFALVRVVRGH